MLALCGACATQESATRTASYTPAGQTDERVRAFELAGVESVDEEDLREGLYTRVDPGWRAEVGWMPLLGAEPIYYNELEFDADLVRIRTFYQERGYFDARVSGVTNNKTRDKGRAIRLKIFEGQPSKVRAVRVEGVGRDIVLPEDLLAGLPLSPGDVFTSRDWAILKASVKRAMQQRSFAYANVSGRAIVHPSKRAVDIVLLVDPGPKASLGDVTIEGLPDNVDEQYVRDAITFKRGEAYSADALTLTQNAIYELGVFSLVNVQPAFNVRQAKAPSAPNEADAATGIVEATAEVEDVTGMPGALGISRVLEAARIQAEARARLNPVVPIVIQLKPAKNWSARGGGGVVIDSTRQDVHLGANASSRNFFDTLGKLDLSVGLGYAWTPGIINLFNDEEDGFTLGNNGVIVSGALNYEQPQFLERRTRGFLSFSAARDVQERFVSLEPTGSIGLRRPFFDLFILEISYGTSFLLYQNVEDDFRAELRDRGLDADAQTPSQLLEFLDLRFTIDRRNNPLDPTKGFRVELGLQHAGNYLLGGNSTYLKPRLTLEGYLPYELAGFSLVSAARGRVTAIYDQNAPGSAVGVPISSRINAGGAGSMRSFGSRYFGFFTDAPDNPGPIGSISLVEASVEQRVRLARNVFSVGDVWFASFLDAGTFYEEQLALDSGSNSAGTVPLSQLPSDLIFGVGGGLWWVTPIGPVRFDVAWTLDELASDPRFARDEVRAKAESNFLFGIDNFFLGIGHSF